MALKKNQRTLLEWFQDLQLTGSMYSTTSIYNTDQHTYKTKTDSFGSVTRPYSINIFRNIILL